MFAVLEMEVVYKTLNADISIYVSVQGPRETIVHLCFTNNGSDESRIHRHGHPMDHPGSCGRLYRK